MKSVPVSELKAELSRYLREVKRGGEVQILERGVPVARLVGLPSTSPKDSALRQRLMRAGVVRPGAGGAARLLKHPPLSLPDANLSGAIDDDRADRA